LSLTQPCCGLRIDANRNQIQVAKWNKKSPTSSSQTVINTWLVKRFHDLIFAIDNLGERGLALAPELLTRTRSR
jgi:hypothetical protein